MGSWSHTCCQPEQLAVAVLWQRQGCCVFAAISSQDALSKTKPLAPPSPLSGCCETLILAYLPPTLWVAGRPHEVLRRTDKPWASQSGWPIWMV